nr:MAG TPA: hypothetical protein [Caudoviricetes sp.]
MGVWKSGPKNSEQRGNVTRIICIKIRLSA